MRKLGVALLAAAAGMVMGAMPAAASCAPPVPIDQALRDADSVFVGTVVGLENAGRTASFAVDEVWRGPDLPARAMVNGGPDGNAITGVDRSWEANGKYLVFASVVNAELTDNACSNTQIWSGDLAALRPSDARPPADSTDSGTAGGLPGRLLLVIGMLVTIGLVSVLVFRKAR
ncbi:MAG: hypothetical protein WD402_05320 [Chloroflexota bacterium]